MKYIARDMPFGPRSDLHLMDMTDHITHTLAAMIDRRSSIFDNIILVIKCKIH